VIPVKVGKKHLFYSIERGWRILYLTLLANLVLDPFSPQNAKASLILRGYR
jgi:hypothetical protein